jgi:hypothetical protein
MIILVMYMDDLIITGNNDDHISQVKKELHDRFKMTNLVLLHYYLGVEVFQQPKTFSLVNASMYLNYWKNLS